MTPAAFECYCRDMLAYAGWSARVVGQSGDQGADILARRDDRVLVVQCKRYAGGVGNKAVQEVYAAKAYYHATDAAVVSHAPFTTSARALARATGVLLLGPEHLLTVLRPTPPEPPQRPSVSIQLCACDAHLIRLPAGRRGMVRCPMCPRRFYAIG